MSGNVSTGDYFNVANNFPVAYGVGEGANEYAYFLTATGTCPFRGSNGARRRFASRQRRRSIAQGFQYIYSTAAGPADAAIVLASGSAPLTTQAGSSVLNGPNGMVQLTGFQQITPTNTDAANASAEESAIDFVLATLANWNS